MPQPVESIGFKCLVVSSGASGVCNGRGRLKKRAPHVPPTSHDPSTVLLGVEGSGASESQVQVAGRLDGALVDQRFVGESAGASFFGQALLDDAERLPNAIELALNFEPGGCGETLCGHLHLYTDQSNRNARSHKTGTMWARIFPTSFGENPSRKAKTPGGRAAGKRAVGEASTSRNRAAASPPPRMDRPRGRTRVAPLN